ncbi:MAG: methyltransferase domain-containing protein [Planctomycetes bacterium]|nr:methyltransferase domain-containing protein [Planctomycetota bacterium]
MSAAHADTEPDRAEEFGSRRIFLPPPRDPRRAALYRDWLRKLGLDAAGRKLARKHLKAQPGESLLHMGCGDGGFTVELKGQHPQLEIEGVDPDAEAVSAAAELSTERGVHVLFKKGYPQDLPATSERHDVVLCLLFLYRMQTDQDRGDALGEFKRVLRPGGRLLLIEPGVHSRGPRGWLMKKLAACEPGLRAQLNAGLETLLKQAGFEDVKSLERGAAGLVAAEGVKK